MKDFFWQSYLQLENDVLDICSYYYVNDEQLDVYSLRISDLIVRINIEIESIAKDLYYKNNPNPKKGNPKYDMECLKFLNDLWEITEKEISIVNSFFDLEKENNKLITPLKEVIEKGKPEWKDAYQSLKHNRANSITKGTLRNMLLSLGSLYILNIYNKDYVQTFENLKKTFNMETNFGSRIFATTLFPYNPVFNKNTNLKKFILIAYPEINEIEVYKERTLAKFGTFINYALSDRDFNQYCDSKNLNSTDRMTNLLNYMKEYHEEIIIKYGKDVLESLNYIPYKVTINRNQLI